MPEISRFYGIVIKMYFMKAEHNPPHFHAIYGEHVGEVDINKLELIDGYLPPKAKSLVIQWGRKYQKELLEIWNLQQFRQLNPLE